MQTYRTMPRNDVHRPASILPEDYQYVAQECMRIEGIADCYMLQEHRRRIQAHMARTGGTYSHHVHGGNCMVCGSVNAVYTVLFYHVPTNTYIRTGQDCAEKLDSSCNEAEFNAFRTALRDAREANAGRRKAMATLEDQGLAGCWDIFTADADSLSVNGRNGIYQIPYEEMVIRDIVGKLVKYGSISPAQMGFLSKLVVRISQRPVVEAKRKAESDAAALCPTGRVVVKGKIVSTRTQESEFGMVTKMLVKAEEGYKVWCTMPSGLSDAKVNDVVAFKVTLTPSGDDPKFGFGTRPAAVNESKQLKFEVTK